MTIYVSFLSIARFLLIKKPVNHIAIEVVAPRMGAYINIANSFSILFKKEILLFDNSFFIQYWCLDHVSYSIVELIR